MKTAALFDLDGTLIDSEGLTDSAIGEVMAAHGHPGASLPPYETRGRTWKDIAFALHRRYGLAASRDGLAEEMLAAWEAGLARIEPIPGATQAVRDAALHLRVAVVSSSPLRVIHRVIEQLGLEGAVPAHARVGAEDIGSPKPAPDAFLLGARRLGVAAGECVVFEDSLAGLQAARAAGMSTVLVLHRCAEPDTCRPLADRAIDTYRSLPAQFWRDLER